MNMLVAGETKKFVFDKRAADCSASGVAVQLRHFFVAGDVRILVVKIRRRIEPVRSAMKVSAAVKSIGAGCGAHVDMSSAGGSLLRVVHGSVDTKFLNRLWGRRR